MNGRTLDDGGGEDGNRGVGWEPCASCGQAAWQGEPCGWCGAESVDTRLNTIVAGRYRIDTLLGAGGMGRVYRAEHLGLSEPVAVKFLLREFAIHPEMRARFQREARVLARLRHRGIVTVIDFGEHEQELYLVMEMLKGEALDHVHGRSAGPMRASRAVGLIDQVLQVLEVAHAAGVVHRDLKPENLFVEGAGSADELVKVLDFGIAGLIEDDGRADRLTAVGTVRGTPQYMSPEQCVGRDIGPATDIYAVGMILYELLTGDVPFTGESVAEVMSMQMFVAPPPFAVTAGDVSSGLEALVLRALSKNAAARPSAAVFRQWLANVMGTAGQELSRAATAGLAREERAIAPERTARSEGRVDEGFTVQRVALWGFGEVRAKTLRVALGAHGVTAIVISDAMVPDRADDDGAWRAVVISASDRATERLRALRSVEALSKVPVIALDLQRVEEAAELIRAGASDACLSRVDDAEACKKVLRALRRGR